MTEKDFERENFRRKQYPGKTRFSGKFADRAEGGQAERPPRPGHDGPRGQGRPFGRGPNQRVVAAIQEIDEELLQLIRRRARLVSKISPNGAVDPEAEKKLRLAWEQKSSRLAHDNRLSREMFNIIQAVEALPDKEEEQSYFNLAPSLSPVEIDFPVPSDQEETLIWMALAAASGQTMTLRNVLLNDAMLDALKAFNQIGGQLWWEDDGSVINRGGGLPKHLDKVVYVGGHPLALWLALCLCLGFQSRLKLMGDKELHSLRLSEIRNFLPGLGARLTNVIPGQDSLPIRMENSGMLPPEIVIPATLPPDFFAALLVSAAFRELPATFVLPPEHTASFLNRAKTALTILRQAGLPVIVSQNRLTVQAGSLTLPEQPVLNMDMDLAVAMLLMPALTQPGGKTHLRGAWPLDEAHTHPARSLLSGSGLNIVTGDRTITATSNLETPSIQKDLLAQIHGECPSLFPIAVSAALAAADKKSEIFLPDRDKLMPGEADIVEGFLDQLGFVWQPSGRIVKKAEMNTAPPWLAPSAVWALAMALGAFVRTNIRLRNPGIMSGRYPFFWKLYNMLPKPDLSRQIKKQESADVQPTRRRIIARGVFGEIPEGSASGNDRGSQAAD